MHGCSRLFRLLAYLCALRVGARKLFKLFKQSSRRDSQFLRGERKSACRDVVYLVCRWVLRARERGVSNTLLGDQRVRGRQDRIGLDSAVVAATFWRGGSR